MNSNTEKFLKEIGVTNDAIDQLKGEDDIEVKDLSDGFKTSLKDVFINNPDVINPIKKEIQGKELSQIEHKIKKAFSLTSEEIKDKKFDEIIALVRSAPDPATARTQLMERNWSARGVEKIIQLIDEPGHQVSEGIYKLSEIELVIHQGN